MRQSIALFFIALVAMSSATKVNEDISYLKKVGNSEFGKTLIESIQIELKSSEGQDSVNRIIALLKDLKASIQQEAKTDKVQHEKKEAECAKQDKSLVAQIKSLKNAISLDKALIVTNNAAIVLHSKLLKGEYAARKADRAALKENLATQNSTKVTYRIQFTKLANQISALAAARSLIAQLKNNQAFAETGSQTFIQVSSGLKNIVFQHEKYQGFIDVLAQLLSNTQQIVADQALVKDILELIDTLSALLFKESQLLTKIFKQRMKDLKAAAAKLRISIANHTKQIAVEKATLAALKDSNVKAAQRILTNQQSLSSRRKELKDLRKDCHDARVAYEGRVQRRKGELVIVEKVLVIFQTRFSDQVRSAVGLL